jgi:hypothetical protein
MKFKDLYFFFHFLDKKILKFEIQGKKYLDLPVILYTTGEITYHKTHFKKKKKIKSNKKN